ncbi:MAG: class I tRNA ligase family protein [Patescibacteria group bacterium]|nr:class I tRNA ligase family protein [Patescibacteria group bacterium]
MKNYNPEKIEKKWQRYWEKKKLFQTKKTFDKPKYYILDMFPYPSGAGLHVGHPKGYIATDVIARMKQMQGFNVLHPMGWDAFGLPAENYAIKNKVHPRVATEKNIKIFKKQLGLLGFTYDWSREINTTDPEYYKWTQWMFLQMFKKGLAYESYAPINWCPSCQTGLANEDLEDGKCERCGSAVEQKPMRQWVLKITDYAERLLNDLDKLKNWPEAIKEMQKNWIGRSEGATVRFVIASEAKQSYNNYNGNSGIASSSPSGIPRNDILEVFTTRPDTLFGATYVVVAPEHSLIENCLPAYLRYVNIPTVCKPVGRKIENFADIAAYVEKAKHKTVLERSELQKDKTGVEIKGIKAINPVNGEELPIFVADYVIGGYGAGAVMAVPAHDDRDMEFAKKYGLPIKTVVEPITGQKKDNEEFRRSIVALVRDPKNNKLLSLNWGEKFGGNLFIGGGLKDGEDAVKCAQREIEEETGYKNVKLIAESEKIHHHYFAASKNVNREIEAVGLFFELSDEKNGGQNLTDKEKDKFKLEWITEKEADEKVKDPLHHYLFEKFVKNSAYTGDGLSVNSTFLDGLSTKEAKEKIIKWLEDKKYGERKINYKLRDWVFSRQRYWGEPIPLIFCPACKKSMENFLPQDISRKETISNGERLNPGWMAIPEDKLPIKLPNVKSYVPTGTGESPLAGIQKWVNVKCPKCGGPAKRETNTMPQWAGSCWYYLAYIMKKISNFPAYRQAGNFPISNYSKAFDWWLPVDFYVGGAEHATRHLIYARFWHKFLYDIGVVNKEEPFEKLQSVGLILAEDGRKMSKRWGNVINPDDVVKEFGADAMRVYEMFMGPFSQPCAWNTNGLVGTKRFLEKVWFLFDRVVKSKTKQKNDGIASSSPWANPRNDKITSVLHQTIKKVTEDIEAMRFNTAIAKMMELANELSKQETISIEHYSLFIKILSPFAPHFCEEIWSLLGHKKSVIFEKWPEYDAKSAMENEIILVVQVNGKVRDSLIAPAEISEEEAKKQALASEKIQKWLEGKEPKKIIYVKGKLVSIVV